MKKEETKNTEDNTIKKNLTVMNRKILLWNARGVKGKKEKIRKVMGKRTWIFQ